MKTDNSISTNVESLEDAVIKFLDSNTSISESNPAKVIAFNTGANWQKEQYKPIIESHAELLSIIKNIVSINGVGYTDLQRFVEHLQPFIEEAKQAIEKANNLIK